MAESASTGKSIDYDLLLKQALRAVEKSKQQLSEMKEGAHQPIAIVGIGCRFPGGVWDVESFWKLLESGYDAISEVPNDRWNIDEYHDVDVVKPGKMVSRYGGFLEGIDRFDAAFFGIAPREAAMMDPQQRLLLEVAWHACEDAGIAPRSLEGSATGVYLGIASGDYAQLQLKANDARLLDVHYASGNAHSVASGRLSYILGLKGPSLSIDTACSSSLVAVHLACRALRAGECTMALAGGVNLILAPETTIALSQAHMLAPDGRSKVFDDRADGFSRAEGCGVVVLKPLIRAQADGDRIYAVIRGTAMNQDGASSSLTAPNGPSQEALMRQALADARMSAERIGYVEAHGTGTPLGDPIELQALGAVYGQARDAATPLMVGSLKTNVGHMEAAAGVGGLIKLALALNHRRIPAHLQFEVPTQHVSWTSLRLAVPRSATTWREITDASGNRLPCTGAVSSFGFSGTNVHLIVEEGPASTSDLADDGLPQLTMNPRLPLYPFNRKRFWFNELEANDSCGFAATKSRHRNSRDAGRVGADGLDPLLGRRIHTRSNPALFQAELSTDWPVGLGQHVVHGRRVLPGAAYLAMALLAVEYLDREKHCCVVEVEFPMPCIFDEARVLETMVYPANEAGKRQFEIASTALNDMESDWTVHARGLLDLAGSKGEVVSAIDLSEIQRRAHTTLDHGEFYRRFDEVGLNFGEAFRSVARAWGSEDQGLVELKSVRALNVAGGVYTLDPKLLDACLQSAAALTKAGQPGELALPAEVQSFRVLDRYTPIQFSLAQVKARNERGVTVDVTGLDAHGTPVLEVRGLVLLSVHGKTFSEWLYEIDWEQIDLPVTSPAVPGFGSTEDNQHLLLDSDEVLKTLQDALAEELSQSQVREFEKWVQAFDRLCAGLLVREFERGGFAFSEGREFASGELVWTLAVAPRHERLVQRFLEVLIEFSYLKELVKGEYRVLPRPFIDVDLEAAGLAVSGHPEFDWTMHGVSRLLPLLCGRLGTTEALFDKEGIGIATRLYRESVSARSLNRALGAAAAEAARQIREKYRKLRVLEIGAGTGSTTSYLLPALRDYLDEYVWTDIGPGFVAAAKEEFGSNDRMRFEVLDIEADPYPQEFAGESFDLVVASNVLHATAELRQTLQNVRSLIRPGGVLLIAETTASRPWIDMTVGFTEGWWRFRDFDLRPNSPLIGGAAWIELLQNSGFESVSISSGSVGQALGDQCLFLAFAPTNAVDNAIEVPVSRDRLLLVTGSMHGERSECADLLMKLAKASGADVLLIGRDEASAERIDSYFADPNDRAVGTRPSRTIVFLPGVEIQAPSRASAREAMQWQELVLGGALLWTQAWLGSNHASSSKIWLVSRGSSSRGTTAPDGATLAALARSIRSEHPGSQVFAVDISGAVEAIATEISMLCKICTDAHEPEVQYAIQQSTVWVPRLKPRRPSEAGVQEQTRRLRFADSGLVDDLKTSLEPRISPGVEDVEIAIRATAINFHEVLESFNPGRQSHLAPGGECVGVVTRVGDHVQDLSIGEEVVAIGTGLMADHATLPRKRLWKKPPGLSCEQCATLIVPFLTARWSLLKVARLKAGETVLIHSAAGGVGLAAIQVARRAGAFVIATAGSEEKRACIRNLGVVAVFDSRSTEFEHQVMKATRSQGVDVVLNSLSGARTAAGLRCLSAGGRFVELGEVATSFEEEARRIRPDVICHRVHLRASLMELTEEICAEISAILEDAVAGTIEALPFRVFALSDAASAFRSLTSGQHIGRVLLSGDVAPDRLPRRFGGFKSDAAYLVTGAFNGLGKLIVQWLVEEGAGYVLALGRNDPDTETRTQVVGWREHGTQVSLRRCDVTDVAALSQLIESVPGSYRLRGVFHAAGVLENAALEQQTWETFYPVLSPKVAGAWNLHRLTESIDLDCFVLFSSAAAVLGARGQSNHAAACAYLDALAHYRREVQGKTALSIDWGAWSGVGAAVRHDAIKRGEGSGVQSIAPADGMRLLRRLMDEDATQVIALPVHWQRWASSSKAEAAANRHLLKHVLSERNESASGMKKEGNSYNHYGESQGVVISEDRPGWREQLLALPEGQRMAAVSKHLEQRIRKVLSLGPEDGLDEKRPLQEYGLDSLLSIELRNELSKDVGSKLPNTALFDYPTIATLKAWLYRDVMHLHAEQAEMRGTDLAIEEASFRDLDSLSEEEIDKLLQRRMAGLAQ